MPENSFLDHFGPLVKFQGSYIHIQKNRVSILLCLVIIFGTDKLFSEKSADEMKIQPSLLIDRTISALLVFELSSFSLSCNRKFIGVHLEKHFGIFLVVLN